MIQSFYDSLVNPGVVKRKFKHR